VLQEAKQQTKKQTSEWVARHDQLATEKVQTDLRRDAMAEQLAKMTLQVESTQTAQKRVEKAHAESVAVLQKVHEEALATLTRQHGILREGLMQVIDIQGSENMAISYMMQQDLVNLDAAIKKSLAHMKAAEREAATETVRSEMADEIESALKNQEAMREILSNSTTKSQAKETALSAQLAEATGQANELRAEVDKQRREEAISLDNARRELEAKDREFRKVKKELSWLKHQKEDLTLSLEAVPESAPTTATTATTDSRAVQYPRSAAVPGLKLPQTGLMYGGNPLYLRTPRPGYDTDPSTEPDEGSPTAWT